MIIIDQQKIISWRQEFLKSKFLFAHVFGKHYRHIEHAEMIRYHLLRQKRGRLKVRQVFAVTELKRTRLSAVFEIKYDKYSLYDKRL